MRLFDLLLKGKNEFFLNNKKIYKQACLWFFLKATAVRLTKGSSIYVCRLLLT